METKYSFSTPGVFKGFTAEQAALELTRIRGLYGKLKPEYVVKESKKKESLLHNYFDWDNKSAAERWRNEQARLLIANIKVEIVHEQISTKIRAFVNVREQKDLPRNYVPVQDAILNTDAYNDLLEQAKRDMENFISVYSQISELNSVKAEMLKVLAL